MLTFYISVIVLKPTVAETIRLHRLHWFGHVQRMEGNSIPKRLLYVNFETRMRGRPRNSWQDEVRENGRLVGRKECQEWKKHLRTATNCHILHMPME
jgi:hypothetical protein